MSSQDKREVSNAGGGTWIKLAVVAIVLLLTVFKGHHIIDSAKSFASEFRDIPNLVNDMQATLERHGRGDVVGAQIQDEASQKREWKRIAATQDYKCAKCKAELETTFFISTSRSDPNNKLAFCANCGKSLKRS